MSIYISFLAYLVSGVYVYPPVSSRWVYISKLVYLVSGVYVYPPVARRWVSECRTHETWRKETWEWGHYTRTITRIKDTKWLKPNINYRDCKGKMRLKNFRSWSRPMSSIHEVPVSRNWYKTVFNWGGLIDFRQTFKTK